MIASVDEQIYKISFHFHIGNDDECASFKEKTLNHLIAQMGISYEAREVERSRLFIWSGYEGNVVLEFQETDVGIILTSSVIRSAKRRSFLKRLLGT